MQRSPEVIATHILPFGEAEVVEWRWPSPLDVTVCEQRHMIEMSLPPLATSGTASFPDLGELRPTRIGSVFVRPAGVAIRARSMGGRIRVVRLAADADAFSRLTDADPEFGEAMLRAALDLNAPRLRALLRLIRDELTHPGLASANLIEAYGVALVVETARALRSSDACEAGRALAGWQSRRIEERLSSEEAPPTLPELARLCGVSVRHFARLYLGHAGEPVRARIARDRTRRAQALLVGTDLPLKEVAARLGFEQPASFSTAFRRSTGISPLSYRQRRRPSN